MNPAQALEALIPYAAHRWHCADLDDYGDPGCDCGLADAVRAAYDALSDAEPRVGPGRAEPDVVRP